MPIVDCLWYRGRGDLTPDASRVVAAVNAYLCGEAEGLNVAEPEVEEAVQAIPDDAPDELRALAGVTWRHITAQNSHRFDRARQEDRPLSREEAQQRGLEPDGKYSVTETVAAEHPVSAWIRGLTDAVVLALIRENPHWLRNAAVADRVCQRRLDLLRGDDAGAAFLRALGQPGVPLTRRQRPEIGPRWPASIVRDAVRMREAQHRSERDVWLRVREERPDSDTLIAVGRAFLLRLSGWDAPAVVERFRRQDPEWCPPLAAEEHVLKHLGLHVVIVHPADDDPTRWVTIEDGGWPRAATVALLAARWRVSNGWIRKKLTRQAK